MPPLLTSVRDQVCDEGLTRKTLWKAFDGTLIESVLMRYPDRVTMCVSSQAGCGMNCPFCATGQAGLTRNLSTGEIVEQVVAGARALARGEIPGGPGRVSNIVFMGMGEPLAVLERTAGGPPLRDPSPAGLGISAAQHHRLHGRAGARDRPPRRAGAEGTPRGVAARAGRRVARRTRADQHALEGRRGPRRRLGLRRADPAAHLDRVRAHPRHQRPGVAGRPPRPAHQGPPGARQPDPAQPHARLELDCLPPGGPDEFVRRLEAHGVPATVRDTRGQEIDGACGQLAAMPQEPQAQEG